ncbi:solute carrier family 2, facilitated glucose transporter member 8-like [Babylonia areolata]|uniref:solute carrier family 2, facilitated glucose transporter member 8-like n=1 Tax=Babylonia areolata TaxID=304850 RepID=UPI003FD6B6D7
MAGTLDVEGRQLSTKYEGSVRNMVLCSLFACIGALNFGFTIGYSSPAIPSMIKHDVLKEEDAGWFGSLMTIGALFGGPISGWLIEKQGRKRTIFLSSLPFLLGYGSMIVAQSVSYLYVGRFLTGVGSGMVTVCVPMYVAEIATKSRRGVLGSCVQLFIVIGICLAYIQGINDEWKEMANAALLPAGLAAVAVVFIPETPRWLLAKNRKADARNALAAVRDAHADVQEELRDIEEGLDTQEEMSWSEFFGREELKRPLFICLVVMVCQQFSGINAVMFYTVSIFNTAIPEMAHSATVFIGIVQVIATLIACFLMDHVGRKKLLIMAGSVMAVNLFILGFYFKLSAQKSLSPVLITWLPVVCLTFYIVGFSLGWGPIPMLIMSEIFPARGRGTAGAIAIFFNWLTAFFVTKEFMILQNLLGQDGVFYFFGIFCVFGVWFVMKYLPETKGKSLEDIELYFLGRSSVR